MLYGLSPWLTPPEPHSQNTESGQVHEHGLGRQQETVPHIRRDHFTDSSDEARACMFGLFLLIVGTSEISKKRSDLSSSPGAGWCLRWRICLLLLLPPSAGAVWPGLQKPHLEVLCCARVDNIHREVYMEPSALGNEPLIQPGPRTPCRSATGRSSVVSLQHRDSRQGCDPCSVKLPWICAPRKVLGREAAKHLQAGPRSGFSVAISSFKLCSCGHASGDV